MRHELMTSVSMKVKGYNLKATPVHELTAFQTPTEKLFVVYHMGVPAMDARAWQLYGWRAGEEAAHLTLADLDAMPQVDVRAFHECAGSPLKPTLPVRRVGNVVWRGFQPHKDPISTHTTTR